MFNWLFTLPIMVANLTNPARVAAALVEAVRFGDLEQVQRILKAGFGVNYKDNQHNSILHTAILSGSIHDELNHSTDKVLIVWRYLLKETSFIKDAQNQEGNTILHLLILYSSKYPPYFFKQLLTLMIECGVDVDLLNNLKQLPVLNYFLEPNGNFKLSILNILKLFIQHTPDINTMMEKR